VTKYTGKDMFVRFGTLSIAGQGRNLEVNQAADEIEVTSYGSAAKEYVAGLVDRSATLQVLDDNASNVVRQALAPGTTSSLTWFPIGTPSGNPKFAAATAVITGQNLSYPYDDAVLFECTMRISGAVVESTASASGT
jgi:predicted secreted protein